LGYTIIIDYSMAEKQKQNPNLEPEENTREAATNQLRLTFGSLHIDTASISTDVPNSRQWEANWVYRARS
jgi:hypothetical protein